ncbi:REG-2-like, HAD superfamily (subfamily IA) hydrolase [Gloeothece citriformis PCC 7424]|uniref:REG-2-like, HAD superfamily (Subfamily IA) hydrolase n=1 Tax=Gloeothece citriformis (strain PCC 7424) TaxID=65393 RepID=B7KBF4_GLOC7|nr:HAD-IA family hydrolase [Gloeothece citriformis]ACK71510.1 REG-2-like, HAD superfamily (subfamily IA) hydrolase [Gloeothece citriformis PCC 7424]
MESPKVIFLDAMGTLFGLKGTVGEMYGAIAAGVGVYVLPETLDKTFIQSFKSANPLAFPGVHPSLIPELEFQWWRAIAKSTFSLAGVLEQFEDFGTFFIQLYDYFASSEPWYVYEDVVPALTHWHHQGIELGVISNFDSRLQRILKSLNLEIFFKSITMSSYSGVAKPNPLIFTTALAKHNCSPAQAWHIGDSLKDDYYGATSAGIKAFLIERIN